MDNIPKITRTDINAQIFSCKLKNEKVTWPFILKCARLKETERDNQNSKETADEQKPEEIVINLGRSRHIDSPPYSNQKRQMSRGFTEYHQRNQRLQYGRPPISEWCNLCKRLGHSYKNCRRRLRACFSCGSNDHFVKDCRQNRGTKN